MNNAKPTEKMGGNARCGQCGTLLETGALAGLCPACLLKQGVAADTATAGASPPFQPPAAAELAPLFPQLEILELIGKGGMGAVYKARQPALDRFVALKLLPAHAEHGPAFAERFNREARALARLNHPSIVGVHEFGTAGPYRFFLMEHVDGANLRQLQKTRQLSPREALHVVAQICDALQYAHDQGIVHRDIKPENVLVDRKGRVKIADFGLAKLLDAPPADHRLTAEGQVMGTPHYMAPEQIEHPQTVDHRADIYSLGVVLYELLTGELPLGKFPPPSRKVQVDVRLDGVVLRALEKQPELRYQQAGEVKTAMDTIADAAPLPAASSRAERPPATQSNRMFAWLALGLFLAGTLGTLLLMTISFRHEMALVFGGLALTLALVFGILGWRERLARGIAIAVMSLVGLALAGVVLSGGFHLLRSSGAKEQARQQALRALEEQQRALEAARQATARKTLAPDYIQAEAIMASLEVLGDKLEETLAERDATNSVKYMDHFTAQLLALNRLVLGTEVAFSSNRLALTLKAQAAVKAGDLELGETFFKAAMATGAGDDDYPERIAALAKRQREAMSLPNVLGPVIECELRSVWAGTNCVMDLDTGRVLTPPQDLLKTIPTEVAQKRVLWALLSRLREGKLWQWLAEDGVDLVCGDGSDSLLWLDGFVLGQTLDQSNSVKVLAALQEFRVHAKDYAAAATTNAQYYNNAWLPIPWHRMAGSNYCVLFKTRENRIGLLQVVGQLTNPPGVKIRYRLANEDLGGQGGSRLNPRGEAPGMTAPHVVYQWYRGGSTDGPARLLAPLESAQLKLKLAEVELKDAEEKSNKGVISRQEYVKARFARDLAAAELKQDPLEVARLQLEQAAAELAHLEELFKQGVVPSLEYERAKIVHESAAATYERLKRGKRF